MYQDNYIYRKLQKMLHLGNQSQTTIQAICNFVTILYINYIYSII